MGDDLNIFLLRNLCNEDVVTARIEGNVAELWFVSAYMLLDDEVKPSPDLQRRALIEAKRRRADVIIGTDANCLVNHEHKCNG